MPSGVVVLRAPAIVRRPHLGDRWLLEELRRRLGPTCADVSLDQVAGHVDAVLREWSAFLKDERGFLQFAQQGALLPGGGSYAVEYLVGAGGGGAGAGYAGGGSGGGGGRVKDGLVRLSPGAGFAITVGAAGSNSTDRFGAGASNGTDSSIAFPAAAGGTVTAKGGGRGGNGSDANAGNGWPGGNGGGAANEYGATTGGASNDGGYAGGSASSYSNPWGGCGGGGNGATGGTGGGAAGNGGTGTASSISGSSVTRGGGGAGTDLFSVAGTPGAGHGTNQCGGGTLGVANPDAGVGILRYLGAQRATGGTVTSSGGYTIHTFTSSGTFTP